MGKSTSYASYVAIGQTHVILMKLTDSNNDLHWNRGGLDDMSISSGCAHFARNVIFVYNRF